MIKKHAHKPSFGKRGGGKSFGAGKPWERGSYGRDGGRTSMHPATCSTCGKSCEVPFFPSGSRPVFCNFCFKKNDDGPTKRFGDSSDRRPSFRDSGSRFERPSSDNNTDQLRAINAKLDTILKILDSE